MAHWLFVIGDREPLAWVVENRAMAFRDHIRADAVAKGDRFALYVTRGAFHNPTRDRAQVIATGSTATKVSNALITIGDEEFRQSVKIRFDAKQLPPRGGVDFADLVPVLDFIRKKATWSAYVRKALVPIPEGDFIRIAAAIADHR